MSGMKLKELEHFTDTIRSGRFYIRNVARRLKKRKIEKYDLVKIKLPRNIESNIVYTTSNMVRRIYRYILYSQYSRISVHSNLIPNQIFVERDQLNLGL